MNPSQDLSRYDSIVSLGYFLVSLVCFKAYHSNTTGKLDESDADDVDKTDDTIGPRGSLILRKKKPGTYWSGFFLCLEDPCDPVVNPQGHIALCLAENKLVQESLAVRLMQQGIAINAFSDSIVYCYSGFLGLPAARATIAYFLEKVFFKRSEVSSGVALDQSSSSYPNHINPEHVVFGSGVASLLNHLFYTLTGHGDVILIPAPYYASFEYDAEAIAGCECYPVYPVDRCRPSASDFEKAARDVEKQGKRVRVLLLTNPNDPLGIIYSSDVMLDLTSWARERKIYTIVDEIYALSFHDNESNGQQFKSIIEVLDNDLGNDVMMLWGLSKDFGASGFRVGVLYTQNSRLLQVLANLNIFCGVSQPMQMIVAELLMDEIFVDSFLADSKKALRRNYCICVTKLEEMVIPFVPACAGLFVYADFSSVLPEATFDGEAQFSSVVQECCRIVMTPGKSQRDCKPGQYRICFAWQSPQVLEIAMERLSYLILQIRRNDWGYLIKDTDSLRREVIRCGTMLPSRRDFRR